MPAGLAAALLLRLLPRRAKPVFSALCLLPLLAPAIRRLPQAQSWAAQISPDLRETDRLAYHTMPAAAVAFALIAIGVNRIDPRLIAAVRTSGGSAFTAWRLAGLPRMAWAVLAAAVAACTVAIVVG